MNQSEEKFISEIKTLETERLHLREIDAKTHSALFALSKEFIMEALGLSESEYETEKGKHEGGLSTYNRTFISFILVEKISGKAIGTCGFHNWFAAHSRAEVGYVMRNEDMRNKGYMKEALHRIIVYGFQDMKLNRIEAFIGPKNEASLKLVKHLGFKMEGQLREHFSNNGAMEDSLVFSLLKKEFITF